MNERSYAWPIALGVFGVCLLGCVSIAAYVALQFVPQGSGGGSAVPVVVLPSASDPLSADPQRAALSAITAQSLAGSELADDTAAFLWGQAVVFESVTNTDYTTAQAVRAVELAGRIELAGEVGLPPTLAPAIYEALIGRLGAEPRRVDDATRAELVATLRALAYGAQQAAGGA